MTVQLQRFREFDDGETIPELGYDVVIRRRHLGRLHMPTGSLVACDPLDRLETEPFATRFEPGDYPVVLFAAELRDEILPAYAMLKLRESEPTSWEAARVENEAPDRFATRPSGYPVDSSLGCFMDSAAAKALMDYCHSVMPDENDFRRNLRGQVRRRLEKGYGWANLNLKHEGKIPQADEHLNIVAFDAGYGPGIYSSYLGHADDGALTRIVTDFEILDLAFNSVAF
ncbi:MAG: DUF4241 domain-containing protein [Bradymonadaceae bacterium]